MRFLSGLPNPWRSKGVRPPEPIPPRSSDQRRDSTGQSQHEKPAVILQTHKQIFEILRAESRSIEREDKERFAQRGDEEFDMLQKSKKLGIAEKEELIVIQRSRDAIRETLANIAKIKQLGGSEKVDPQT